MKIFYASVKASLILLVMLIPWSESFSQDRCAATEFNKSLGNRNAREQENSFESWIMQKINNAKLRINTAESFFQIPVVVHIIHKGEAAGVGSNISDAQVLSQIGVLNKDFTRRNADTTDTPSEFLHVAGKFNVEFVLARQTPEGLPTNGILRVKGAQNVWTVNHDEALKASSYWPAEDYLNIWVADLDGSLLGYAQFPVSGLPGLEDADDNRLTDGVVVDYRAFGSIDDGDFDLYADFNKGRAATHEIGHFLGLRHIWGDDDEKCGGDGDYVNDTPDQAGQTSGCPSHPYSSCGGNTMFQNYMDYTNDKCMNLLTHDQVSRITTVMSDCPRRASLTHSPGLTVPEPIANDMGIDAILSPRENECDNSVQPVVRVKNNGTNTVTDITMTMAMGQNVINTNTISFESPLQPSETAEVVFDTVPVAPGDQDLIFRIIETNGNVDAKIPDNEKSITVTIPQNTSLPLEENLEVLPSSWIVENPDKETTWAIRQAANSSTSNKAAYLNFYQYDAAGEVDRLITPLFDLSDATSPYLVFDVAYSQYRDRQDGLNIYVLDECMSVDGATEVYSKYGRSLATTSSLDKSFVPSGPDQWRTEVIDLRDFIGLQKIQLAFAGINDHGNNIYIDNLKIVKNLSDNIAILKVSAPSPVQCNQEVQPVLVIGNRGRSAVTTFRINCSVNGGVIETTEVHDLDLQPGAHVEVLLSSIDLDEGENTLLFEVHAPDGLVDIDPADNQASIKAVVNSSQDRIPIREDFDDDWNLWSSVTPTGALTWEIADTNYEKSVYCKAYNSPVIGSEAWLVSPVLDFSSASAASVFFDLSYRFRDSLNDAFKVLASRDCGQRYDEILYTKTGSSISGFNSTSEWFPSLPAHWDHKYINLNSLVGEENVRLAFVFTNAGGNNIYLDNIELFISDDPDPFVPEDLYTIYGSIAEDKIDFFLTFNLENRQSVNVQVIDMAGQMIANRELHDVLNQTFQIDAANRSAGIYIVRLFITNRFYVDKIYLSR